MWRTAPRERSFPNVIARLRAHWPLKLWLSIVVNGVFWCGYTYLGQHAFFPLWHPPLTWLDQAIPYRPEIWCWVYLSQFLLTSVLPWLLDDIATIRRYVIGVGLMSVVSFALFAIVPVASPRPAGAADGMMGLIVALDGPFNAFPSLHASFLVYLGLLARRLWLPLVRRETIALGLAWGVAILYATVATRQHYVVDLAAGAALGAVADRIVWRRAEKEAAPAMMARTKGVTSQQGCK